MNGQSYDQGAAADEKPGPLWSYLPPDSTEHCECKGQPLKQMFCSFGHMLNCHFPMDCIWAGCPKLMDYDYAPDVAFKIQVTAHEMLATLANPECQICKGSAKKKVSAIESNFLGPNTKEVLEESAEQFGIGDPDDMEITTLCDCVWHVVFHMEANRLKWRQEAQGDES